MCLVIGHYFNNELHNCVPQTRANADKNCLNTNFIATDLIFNAEYKMKSYIAHLKQRSADNGNRTLKGMMMFVSSL